MRMTALDRERAGRCQGQGLASAHRSENAGGRQVVTRTQREATRGSDDSDRRARLRPRNLRTADIRVFSSASDAPGARRPTDIVLMVLAMPLVAALSFAAPGPGPLDTAVVSLVQSLPGLVGRLWEISYDLMLGWVLFVLGESLFAHARKRLLFAELLAATLAYIFAMAAGEAAGTGVSEGLRSRSSSDPPAVYPAMRLAVVTAVIVAASPHLSRPLRNDGRLVVTIGAREHLPGHRSADRRDRRSGR